MRLVAIAGVAVVVALAAVFWKGSSEPRSIDSLVVLPFMTSASDVDVSYLGDELTDSLIDQLTRIRSLRVIARTTAFRYKGERDLRKISSDLNVAAVLTGTVSRRGSELSITAELVDPANDTRLWGDTYTRPAVDLMSVQDAIAAAVSSALMPRLSAEDKRVVGGQGTQSPEAYELFLKARYVMAHDTEEDDREALALFQNAVEKDPRYVDALLGIVVIHVRSAGNGYAPPKAAWDRAEEYLNKVRALAPDDFGIRVHLATRRFMYEWDWAYAEQEFRALSADPQLLLQFRYHPAAMFFWARGWANEAVALMERALGVDPGNLESRVMLGDFLFQAGRIDDAIAYYEGIIKVAADDARPYFGLAEALKRKSDFPGAIRALQRAYELWGEDDAAKTLAVAKTERDYDAAQVEVAKARLGSLHELARDRYVSPVDFARLYAQIGDRDKAFHYLNVALDARSPSVVFLRVDRAWDSVRADQRFVAAVRRVGIP
jgi:TolB-like protein/cytochrome c-type biogenesis protein CcmH/NrfG